MNAIDPRHLDSTHLGHHVTITGPRATTRGILTQVTHSRSGPSVGIVILNSIGQYTRVSVFISSTAHTVEVGDMSPEWGRNEHLRAAAWDNPDRAGKAADNIGSRFD